MTEDRLPRIRLGMVGGGRDAFIGAVHRIAARLDDRFELVAGAFSSTPEKSQASGHDLGLADDRIYDDYAAMAKREARLKGGIEAVAVVTPNHLHAAVAQAFLQRGIHVICDKPLTATVSQARRLSRAADRSEALFVLTHNYSGYPMVRQAREMVAEGRLGTLRVVQVEYPQGWLSDALEETGQKQAAWRTDPDRSGVGGCIGDIGTHAFHLASFVTGLLPDAISAELTTFVEGRRVDDNAQIMLRYANGARGAIWSSQVAVGCENALRLRVYGTDGALDWAQEEPNTLRFTAKGTPTQLITRGGAGSGTAAERVTRLPFGHPEGYLEAFATIYSEAAAAIRAHAAGVEPEAGVTYPGISDGLTGVAFIDACVRSSRRDGRWTDLADLSR